MQGYARKIASRPVFLPHDCQNSICMFRQFRGRKNAKVDDKVLGQLRVRNEDRTRALYKSKPTP